MAYERSERDSRGPRGNRKGRKKVCAFCVDKLGPIAYTDVTRLRRYLSERAKIVPRLSLIHISFIFSERIIL